MRLSPVPVRYFYDAEGAARAAARESSYATHPGPIAAAATPTRLARWSDRDGFVASVIY